MTTSTFQPARPQSELPKAASPALFLALGLLIGYLIFSIPTVPVAAPGVSDTLIAPAVQEDWHGNVRRSQPQ